MSREGIAPYAYSEDYKNALWLLCRQSAFCQSLMEKRAKGKRIKKNEVEEAVALLEYAETLFLEEKEKMGFTDGLRFMVEPACFRGFKFVDGCLTGDYTHLLDIMMPLQNRKEAPENHYTFEISSLILAHYFVETGKWYRENKIKKIVKKVFSLFGIEEIL